MVVPSIESKSLRYDSISILLRDEEEGIVEVLLGHSKGLSLLQICLHGPLSDPADLYFAFLSGDVIEPMGALISNEELPSSQPIKHTNLHQLETKYLSCSVMEAP